MRVTAFLVTLNAAKATIDSTMAYTGIDPQVYAAFDSQDAAGGSESEAEITANLRSEDASSTSSESFPTPTSSPADLPNATPSIVSISSITEYIRNLFKSMFSYIPASENARSKTSDMPEPVQCTNIATAGMSKHEDYFAASAASGGFFTDMREEDFMLLRNIACYENLNKVQEFVDKGVDSIHAMDSYMDKTFWQQNYEPVFSCQFQRRMG